MKCINAFKLISEDLEMRRNPNGSYEFLLEETRFEILQWTGAIFVGGGV
jgi:hypothetical protein